MVVPSELRTRGGGDSLIPCGDQEREDRPRRSERCKWCPERFGVQQDQFGRFDLTGGRKCGIGRFEFDARLLLLLLLLRQQPMYS